MVYSRENVLTRTATVPHLMHVSENANHPLLTSLRWLSAHAGFPATRLSGHAETLLLLAACARAEEEAENSKFLIQRRDGARDSALRAHNLRRSQVHFKCDNSAKV